MAWYNTGTVAIAATKVTGTGTNFLDSKFGIGAGQAFLVPGSGTVKIYEIASVEDATHLTLKTTAGTVAAGSAYSVMSFYTDSVPDFGKRLAAQLSYYQSQMDGWQQIMTGTGTVAITAPDGTVVNISSFAKLTADSVNTMKAQGTPRTANITDVNNMGPTADFLGVWNFTAAADYQLPNVPAPDPGIFEVFIAGTYSGSQRYTTRYGFIYVRHLTSAWNAATPAWGPWFLVGNTYKAQNGIDLDTVTYQFNAFGTSWVNSPPGNIANQYAFLEVEMNTGSNVIVQTLRYVVSGKIYVRYSNNSVWLSWIEVFTSNTIVPIANGGTGAKTAAAALDALGGAPKASPSFSGTADFSIITAVQGSFSTSVGECIGLKPVALNQAAYLRGKLYDGTLHWYLGKGSASSNDLAWSNYLGSNSFNLINSGAATINCASSTYTFQTNGTANGTNWNSTSDGRIKKDKVKLTNVMDVINGLTGYSYKKKINALNDLEEFVEDTGVLAEDLMKVIPSAVSNIGDGFDVAGNPIENVLTANYSAIIPFLIEACKEQHVRIQSLEEKLMQQSTEPTS